MRLTRRIYLSAVLWAVGTCSGATTGAAASVQTLAERIELLDWSDPRRAIRLIDAAATPQERAQLDVPMLEVSGMVFADVHRDADIGATLAALQTLAGRGDRSAGAAAHYVRAYALNRHGQYSAAVTELEAVEPDTIGPATQRYRVSLLRGDSLRRERRPAAAAVDLQQGLEIAQSLGDELRAVHAMLCLAAAYDDSGSVERAAHLLTSAQALSATLGDETVLTAVDSALADVAARRGDPASERRLRLSALDHAKLATSEKWRAYALARLGGTLLQAREFKESLTYSKQALGLAASMEGGQDESDASLHEALALIALGKMRAGQAGAERAITDTLARGNLLDARDMLRDYAGLLERSGYLMMAIQAYQRYGGLGDQLLSGARASTASAAAASAAVVGQHAAVPVGEHRASASMQQPDGLAQQLILAIAVAVGGICAALVWVFFRIERADARVRLADERDGLTGLLNRRHFNKQVQPAGDAPLTGCVLLADLDRFQRVNDTWGYRAGDAVLAALSQRLAGVLQEGDTLVRWEGEEFLLLLGAASPEHANLAAERLLQAVRQEPVPWDGHAIHCTLSIGYACFPLAGATADMSLPAAINLVHKALRAAKRRGRDRACLISAVGERAKKAANVADGGTNAAVADGIIELTGMGVAA